MVAGDGIEPPTRGFSTWPGHSVKIYKISHLRRLPYFGLSLQWYLSAVRFDTWGWFRPKPAV